MEEINIISDFGLFVFVSGVLFTESLSSSLDIPRNTPHQIIARTD
jgi:hypothetical protein